MAGDDLGIQLSERHVQNGRSGNIHHEVSNRALYEDSETQAGVARIEAVSRTWDNPSLIIAYLTYVYLLNM